MKPEMEQDKLVEKWVPVHVYDPFNRLFERIIFMRIRAQTQNFDRAYCRIIMSIQLSVCLSATTSPGL